jgi:hypothetical protein
MGFWNVKARDLRYGDEIRVTVMGGEEYLTVHDVDTGGASGRIAVLLSWGSHIPQEPFWDDLDPSEKLTVRR